MDIKKYLPVIYFLMGILFTVVAFYLSLQWEIGIGSRGDSGGGVDIAADGGALGFAILSGVCFICSAYLVKWRE